MLLTILFYFFVFAVIIQLLYWIFLYGKFAFLPDGKAGTEVHSLEQKQIPVSVIIAARNEAENLQQFLPKILNQNYPHFEVIVVNDASTDNTLEVLKELENVFDNFQYIDLAHSTNYTGNKKNAVTKGIEASKYDHILCTDADCQPGSKNWISGMANRFIDNKEVILGYGAYQKLPTFINKLIRYETLLTAIQYFSYTKAGIPYMGIGRNLGYKKKLFVKSQGFESHQHIKSGDDDLFVSEVATKKNTAICFSANTFTISLPKKTYLQWFRQKRRHITTAHHYKPIHKLLLGLFHISQLLFWILAIILLTFSLNWQFIILLIIIRFIAQYIVISKSAFKLNEKDLIFLSTVLDIILVFTQLGLFFSNLIQKPKDW